MKEIFNVLNDWVEKLYPDLNIGEVLKDMPKKPRKEGKEQVPANGDVDREI